MFIIEPQRHSQYRQRLLRIINKHQPTFLKGVDLPSIAKDSLQQLNRPFTEAEVKKVIKNLPKHKSLLSRVLWSILKHSCPRLVNIFNIAAKSGTFPSEMFQAIIVTIPKPGKDPSQPQNYRPISLLNSDLKIFVKPLANRLMNITPTLIGLEQVGFVKGRQAADSTRHMINLLRYAEVMQ